MTIDLGHPPVAQVADGAADGARMEADEVAKRRRQRMIRIAITAAAFDAIAAGAARSYGDGSLHTWYSATIIVRTNIAHAQRGVDV